MLVRLLLLCSLLFGLNPQAQCETGQWRLLDSSDVLTSACRWNGVLEFTDARAVSWELVTRIEDPAVTNQGEGRFYPIPAAVVSAALDQLDPAIRQRLSGTIYLLPYPRRDLMHSSCDGRAIYLSPTVVPATIETVHFLLFHEIGHLLHRQLLPDEDQAGWAHYAGLIAGEQSALVTAVVRPGELHELFAEQFRTCLGSDIARDLSPSESELKGYFNNLLCRTSRPAPAPGAGRQLAASGGDIPAFAVAN
jgi:hypothetical protein